MTASDPTLISINKITDFVEQLDATIHWQKEILDFINEWQSDKDFIEVKTSGSTGPPKTIRLKKTHLLASAKATIQYFNIPENATALLCLPARFIAGKMIIVRAIVGHWNLHMVKPSTQIKLGSDTRYAFSAMTPQQVAASDKSLKQIDTLIIGGAPMDFDCRKMINKSSVNAYETYGMTETITHIAVKKTTDEEYTALPGVNLSTDNRQCLVITAEHIGITNLVTNDVVEMTDLKKFKWLSRFDNVVNSAGIKLFPEQIEKKIAAWLNRPFYLCGVPDAEFGQKLVMVVEGSKLDKYNLNLLYSELQESLDRYEIPKEVHFVEIFKRTESGKVKRDFELP